MIGPAPITKDNLNFDENYKKYRFSFGTKLNLKGPNSLTIKYILQELESINNITSHIKIKL